MLRLPCIYCIAGLLSAVLLLPSCIDKPGKINDPPQLLVIQPYGDFPAGFIKLAEEGIKSKYKFKVRVEPTIQLPASAYYKPRNRYIADTLVDMLGRNAPADAYRVVGLTTKDISTEKGDIKNYGIMGLGALTNNSCVVSTFRIRRGASMQVTKERFVKIVNHEIGHTLGLDHCSTPNCVMQDVNGQIQRVDAESGDLCAVCADKVSPYLVQAKGK